MMSQETHSPTGGHLIYQTRVLLIADIASDSARTKVHHAHASPLPEISAPSNQVSTYSCSRKMATMQLTAPAFQLTAMYTSHGHNKEPSVVRDAVLARKPITLSNARSSLVCNTHDLHALTRLVSCELLLPP